MVESLWAWANQTLYDDRLLEDAEIDRAKGRLAEYFRYSPPAGWSAGHQEVLERITLVQRWIARGRAKGENRFVPIPSIYFDVRQPSWFVATKPWYRRHCAAKADIRAKALVTKCIRAYLKALEPGGKVGPAEAYRIIAQKLGKIDENLVKRFQVAVNEAMSTTKPNQP
jgi:hypothetical protein